MSLVQVWVEGDVARVAVDTMSVNSVTGVRSENSKLLSLPHANVVLASRGSDVAFSSIFVQIFLQAGCEDFDSIERAMEERHAFIAQYWPEDHPDDFGQCEIYLVGYSEAQGRMACTSFKIDFKKRGVPSTRMPRSCWAAPGFKTIPALDCDEGMLELAATQVKFMIEEEPLRATGGRLLVAEIRRGAIETRDLGAI